jgi:L-malate glycosyltransferase
MMKIAILSTISGYAWGGTEEVWLHLAKRALEQGHEVMVAADHQVIASDPCRSLLSLGLQTSARRKFRPVRLHLLKNRIKDDHHEALRFQPDVLLINAGSPYDLSYNGNLDTLVRKFNCKKVFFCHFNSDRLKVEDRERSRALFASMDHLVFVNQANHGELEVQLAIRLERASVILNTTRLVLPEPLPMPVGSEVRFANVARLETAWKGQDILARVFAAVPWNLRDCSLECYGVGPDESYIRNLIEMLGCGKQMSLGGYVRDIEQVWRDRHALLLPSRGEGTPLVAVEAMMCGRPVIATAVGGNREIIEDGVTGFLADAPTPASFSDAMERAWLARTNWDAIGRAAHHRARKLVDADPSGKLLDILRDVVRNQP